MQTKYDKRFYSPQLSEKGSITMRRYAWYIGKHMTEAAEKMIQLLPFIMDSSKACQACKDSRKCDVCAFNVKNLSEDEQYKILKAI